jgi:hypothetical protein
MLNEDPLLWAGSDGLRALELRFGGSEPVSQRVVCERVGWSQQLTKDTISRLLHSIPTLPEQAPLEVSKSTKLKFCFVKPLSFSFNR